MFIDVFVERPEIERGKKVVGGLRHNSEWSNTECEWLNVPTPLFQTFKAFYGRPEVRFDSPKKATNALP
jgi:hypothetical protein